MKVDFGIANQNNNFRSKVESKVNLFVVSNFYDRLRRGGVLEELSPKAAEPPTKAGALPRAPAAAKIVQLTEK